MEHRPVGFTGPAPSVFRITSDRMAERRQVDADLMRATGVEVTAQECMRAPFFDHLVPRARKPSALDHRHALAIPGVAADRAFELAGVRLHGTPNDGQIRAAQAAVFQLRGQGAMRDVVQNHVLQLVSLVMMEPPADFNAESIRDE